MLCTSATCEVLRSFFQKLFERCGFMIWTSYVFVCSISRLQIDFIQMTHSISVSITPCYMQHLVLMTYSFNSSDRTTTDTDEAAIAADAIHGCSTNPAGLNTPVTTSKHHITHWTAATGAPIILIYSSVGNVYKSSKTNINFMTELRQWIVRHC